MNLSSTLWDIEDIFSRSFKIPTHKQTQLNIYLTYLAPLLPSFLKVKESVTATLEFKASDSRRFLTPLNHDH